MRSMIAPLIAATALALTSVSTAVAQDSYQHPCATGPATAFDFWVGDWVVFDTNTGVVQGIDRIEKINEGCALFQEWRQMTDRFRAPGAPDRYAGISLSSVITGGGWQQVWVGVGGGTITVSGGLDEEGTMVLESAPATAQNGQVFKRKWHWDPKPDGTVHSWGEIRTQNEDGSWSDPTVPWDIQYVRRSVSPNLVAAPAN